jgi:diacylglycerol kinase family enzyme
MGTGNDGSDGRDLPACLGRLLGPCRASPSAAVRMTPAAAGGKSPAWAFNILSLGADAFIGDMTNKLKTAFPGDSYKLWVDISTVLYDFGWPPRPMSVAAFDFDGSEVTRFERECLLFAIGVSGNRQYGSNKKILPDSRNACFVRYANLLRKIAIKGPLQSGGHASVPEAELFSATRIEIGYPGPILFQCDGEVGRLEAQDFPLVVEVVPAAYEVLAPA